MESLVATLLNWFAVPRNGLMSVFTIALISATLLPLGSEPAVFGYAKLNPGQFWLVVAVATLGNTLGGVIDYMIGRGAKSALSKAPPGRYLRWFERMGPRTLLLSWLPVVGDPLCALAGWLKMPFWQSVLWMAVGKFLRYASFTAMLLWIPDAWWVKLLRPFMGA